jgi:RNA polymerase sigma factor (sigma-70 family)
MEKYPFVYKELYPHLESVFNEFLRQHESELSNRVIESFLSNTEYYRLFVYAVCFPTPHHQKKLDEAFQQFFSEVRLVHYISKVISRVSRDRYQRERKRTYHMFGHSVIHTPKMDKEEWERYPPEKQEDVIDIVVRNAKRLSDHISDPSLYQALTQLTTRQIDILELYFLYHLTHEEIGQVLGISQQSVSKSYNKALTSLRALYKEGENVGSERMD